MRYHEEVWKQKFKLIFVLIKLSEMHGEGRVKRRFWRLSKITKVLICKFFLTACETRLDVITKNRVYEMPRNFTFRLLENQELSTKPVKCMKLGRVPSRTPKLEVLVTVVENWKKPAI